MLTRSPVAPAREPVFNLPAVILACVGGLVLIHAVRVFVLAPETSLELLVDFAVVPARWSAALDPSRAEAILQEARAGLSAPQAGAREALARYILSEADAKPWTALTYALLHGSWSHVLLNSVWLAAFGTPVARRCGVLRFLAVLAAATVGGAVVHAALNASSVIPMIGASAGVSGLTAAAATFVFAPDPSGPFDYAPPTEPHDRPRQSIGALLSNRSAATFLAVWFGTNLLFGLFAEPLGIIDSGIAWEAHLGGFATGLVLFPWLDRPDPLPT